MDERSSRLLPLSDAEKEKLQPRLHTIDAVRLAIKDGSISSKLKGCGPGFARKVENALARFDKDNPLQVDEKEKDRQFTAEENRTGRRVTIGLGLLTAVVAIGVAVYSNSAKKEADADHRTTRDELTEAPNFDVRSEQAHGRIPNGMKEVTIYLDANGNPTRHEDSVTATTVVVPVEVQSSAVALLESAVAPHYSRFLSLFGASAAEQLLRVSEHIEPRVQTLSPAQTREYWMKIDPRSPLWHSNLRLALNFLRDHEITPDGVLLYSKVVTRSPGVAPRKEASQVRPEAKSNSRRAQGSELISGREAPKPAILKFEIYHFAKVDRNDRPMGILGEKSFTTCSDDAVTLTVELSEPAYCYLISYRPDGTEELCFPEQETEVPLLTDRPRYPSRTAGKSIGLEEGVGMQAFFAVVSRAPLPAYAEWRKKRGESPWKRTAALPNVIWKYDGQDLRAITADDLYGTRSKGRELHNGAVLGLIADWLRNGAGIDAVAGLGFAVGPREPH
jgi:hypothetical protein